MFRTISVLLVFTAFGCTRPKPELESYFDLDSLLNQQVEILAQGSYVLEKTILIDGEQETKTLTPDSAQWSKELSLFREFSITDPAYVGAFEEIKTAEGSKYKLKQGAKAQVKSFFVSKEGEQLSAKSVEDKTIYTDEKEMSLILDQGTISTFSLSGKQKMFLKDTTFYSIKARVIKK